MKIPKGYKILVIDPKGLLLGQIELEGREFVAAKDCVRLADEVTDTLLYGPSGEERAELAQIDEIQERVKQDRIRAAKELVTKDTLLKDVFVSVGGETFEEWIERRTRETRR